MTQPQRSAGLSLLIKEDRAEAAAWRRYAETPSSATRVALFNRYQEFAKQLARKEWHKIGNLGLSIHDCEQLAYEALLQSIDRYDPQTGVPFTAYSRRRVVGAIRNGLAKATDAAAAYNAQKRIERDRLRSLKKAAEESEKEPLELLREIAVGIALGFMIQDGGDEEARKVASGDPSAYDQVSWNQLIAELGRRLEGLPEREKMILDYHYKKDIQFTEIAKLLDLSKGRISQLHSQALKRLRATLSKFR